MAKGELVERLLAAVDDVLLPAGFKRRKRDQEWRRKTAISEEWVHLNWGLDIVNPSLGVKYLELAPLIPPGIKLIDSTMCMLAHCFQPPRFYSLEAGPADVVADLKAEGPPTFKRLMDRDAVIAMLRSSDPKAWPVFDFQARIRILPLMLAAKGDIALALEIGEVMRGEAFGRDPDYPLFMDTFRAKVGA